MTKDKRCINCLHNGSSRTGVYCSVCDDADMYRPRSDIKTKIDYCQYSRYGALPITNVIFAPPATIVFWNDGTKTVVKCDNEAYDPEKGLAMAIAKRALGNKGNYFETFKKWVDPYVEKQKEAEAPDEEEKTWYVYYELLGKKTIIKTYKRKCHAVRKANHLNRPLRPVCRYFVSQELPINKD